MDRSMERQVERKVRTGRSGWVPALATGVAGADLCFPDPRRDFEFRSVSQLPPTRAARTPRSRGIFSKATEPARKMSSWRRVDLSIVALAVAVVAIAATLIVGAPIAITGGGANFNPGPAMVGAASVPPAFIEPSRTR
jgi:hypothetical protein